MTNITETNILRFSRLFAGFGSAHGRCIPKGTIREDGKFQPPTYIVHESLTKEDWLEHLSGGAYGIGVIPLRSDNSVTFGAIDIDDYQIDIEALSQKIDNIAFPLCLCRSKSGGVHLYAFFADPVPAQNASNALKHIAGLLGLDKSEIFPKQTMRKKPDDIGNGINLPYFGGDDTDRYCIRDGQHLTLDEFLSWAEEQQVGPDDLKSCSPPDIGSILPPPTFRSAEAEPAGPVAGRNDFLFRQGCKLMRSDLPEAALGAALHALNKSASVSDHQNFTSGALPEDEVDQIVRGVISSTGGQKPSTTTIDDALRKMNEKYAIVMENGKTVVIHTEFDAENGRRKIIRSRFQDIQEFHQEPVPGRNKEGKPITRPLGKFWLYHPDARRFDPVVFKPNGEVQNAYNLWLGFGVDAKEGDCSLFHDHLKEVICSGNEEHYLYILNWLARMIQVPDKPGEVAVVMRGGKGTGKGMFAKTVGKLLGQHYLQISNSHHFTGNFNVHLHDVVLLFCDEAFWAGDKAGESTLKARITEETIFIEPKGVNGYSVPSCLHILMASNNDWVVPAGDIERRFLVLDVSNKHQQDTGYFAKLKNQMDTGGYEALLYELQNRDISDFNFRKVPKSNALLDQIILSLDPQDQWIYEKLYVGRLLPDHKAWIETVTRRELQDDYINACNDIGQNRKSAQTVLGKRLRKIFPGLITKYAGKDAAYRFPDLETCRKNFAAHIGDTPEWLPAEEASSDVYQEYMDDLQRREAEKAELMGYQYFKPRKVIRPMH